MLDDNKNLKITDKDIQKNCGNAWNNSNNTEKQYWNEKAKKSMAEVKEKKFFSNKERTNYLNQEFNEIRNKVNMGVDSEDDHNLL
jgi:hypothetical protein